MADPDGAQTFSVISGGIYHGPVLQGRDFSNITFAVASAAAPVALAQLPRLVAGFTGREAELAQITELLDPAGPSGAVVVSAVAGLAGVAHSAPAADRPPAGPRRTHIPEIGHVRSTDPGSGYRAADLTGESAGRVGPILSATASATLAGARVRAG